MREFLQCIACQKRYPLQEARYLCDCESLLAVERDPGFLSSLSTSIFDQRLSSRLDIDRSGVWRFREGLLAIQEEHIVCHPEGNTPLYRRPHFELWADVDDLALKHEGENPSGSFKDRGMTLAVSQAKALGAKVLACASTGNTSASLAAYGAQAGIPSVVFLPEGHVAAGKLAQAMAYGAKCLMVQGSFDEAMSMVKDLALQGEVYMVNSLNPFRLEGQKTIIWEILQDLCWEAPDWIVVPGGNLGNTSAFGKAIMEAFDSGWIDKKPRLAVIQAEGASPFYRSYQDAFKSFSPMEADTVATAIRIGNPVNYAKAQRVVEDLAGVVEVLSDAEILEAKGVIDSQGVGCEPASACSLGGIRKLREKGVIKKTDKVVGILTGNILKDTDIIVRESRNPLQAVDSDMAAIREAISRI